MNRKLHETIEFVVGAICLFAVVCGIICALTGCMSDKEYMLRKADIDAKKNHESTYQPILLKGPINIQQGAEIAVKVPNMPFQAANIPDGLQSNLDFAKSVVTTGAIATGAIVGMCKAGDGGNTTTTTTTTTNNVTGGAQ